MTFFATTSHEMGAAKMWFPKRKSDTQQKMSEASAALTEAVRCVTKGIEDGNDLMQSFLEDMKKKKDAKNG